MNYSDLSNPAFHANPYPYYVSLREAGAVVQLREHLWMTGRHDVVSELLKDKRVGKGYLARMASQYGPGFLDRTIFKTIERMLFTMSEPEHTRLRTLLMKAFNSKRIEDLTAMTRKVANRLVALIPRHKPFDVMASFARPLSFMVILELLGLPLSDARQFSSAMRVIALAFETSGMTAAGVEEADTAMGYVKAIFAERLRRRRDQPGSDLISLLLAAEESELRLTDDEIIANIILLFGVGQETTGSMIGNALIALFEHPEQLSALRGQPALMPRAVSECVRYDSSVQTTTRFLLDDMDVRGTVIPKGDTILVCLGSANRDPARFENPDSLIIERERPHGGGMSFGGGIHYCLGARLAAIQLEVAVRALFDVFPSLSIVDPASVRWNGTHMARSVESLVVH